MPKVLLLLRVLRGLGLRLLGHDVHFFEAGAVPS